METEETISFGSLKLGYWLKRISEEQINIGNRKYDSKKVIVNLCDDFSKTSLMPLHIVTLACLVQKLKRNAISGKIQASPEIINYLRDDLHLNEYFSSEIAHVKSENNYNLNLWKVSTEHALMYSQHVSDYLKRTYFKDKDLSSLKVILDELYANIADHSQSQGLAYSFIKYDEQEKVIKIAFCDFGIGIKNSLLQSGIQIQSEFIKEATYKGVSARSNSHNKGFGLDTVVSTVSHANSVIKIFSGTELFISYGNEKSYRTQQTDFEFQGTLIYFDIPISSFEDSDYFEDFEL